MQDNTLAHIIMLIGCAALVIVAIFMLAPREKFQHYGIFVCMFLFVISPKLGINFLADHYYVKGTTQAYEITFLDFYCIVYYVLMMMKRNYRIIHWPPGTFPFIIYCFFSIISCVNSPNLEYSFFEIFRLIKMGFVFMVFYNILLCYNCYSIVVKAFAWGVVLNFGFIFFQRYILGDYAVIGLMKHKNSAGMYINTLMPIYLYIVINVKFKNPKIKLFYVVVFFLCVVSVIFSMSRGAWAVAAMCIGSVMALSLMKGITREKMTILAVTVLVLIAGIIKSYDTLSERFTVGNESGTEGRKSLIINASAMADKNFFGVGINNYTTANTFENNYGDIFSALKYLDEDRNVGKVETIYMLTAAEIGWWGLWSLLLWFLFYQYLALRDAIYYRNSNMAYLAIGVCIGLAGSLIHSTIEWSFRYSQNFYLLVMVFAIIAALTTLRRRDCYAGKPLPDSGFSLKASFLKSIECFIIRR